MEILLIYLNTNMVGLLFEQKFHSKLKVKDQSIFIVELLLLNSIKETFSSVRHYLIYSELDTFTKEPDHCTSVMRKCIIENMFCIKWYHSELTVVTIG